MDKSPSIPLISGIVAAIGASLCCAGPLVLLLLGVSGSWISSLTLLEPYQPFFLVAVFVAFLLAAKRIYRPIDECKDGTICALPKTQIRQKVILWISAMIALILVVSEYWIPLFA